MARKVAIILILVMVTVGVVGLALLQRVRAAGQTWIVITAADSGMGTLRSGLQNATTGDTITFDSSVFPPTSPVNINLNSELPHIIQGNLTIDASGAGVILNGSGILADTVGLVVDSESNTIKGLQILNFSGCGIRLTANARACSISGNTITNNGNGIELYESSNNTISGNTITNNSEGIFLDYSPNNIISVNNITANDLFGIPLRYSSNNSISGNNITDNEASGVALFSSSGNSISGNTIRNNNEMGVRLWSSSNNNIVSGNTITNNRYSGIVAYDSSNCSVSGNNVTRNESGIWLEDSFNCSVYGNNVNNNYINGIKLVDSSNSRIFHNNFINNTFQASVSGGFGNIWDEGYPSGGNYWSDYEENYPNATEIDNSGIWDTPYIIDENNQDNYPIVPEFPSFLIMPLFMTATLLAGVLLKKRKRLTQIKRIKLSDICFRISFGISPATRF